MRGRFLWCDHHGVRGSPPLGSPTRRPPRLPRPRSPAPYRRSRSRSVLRKSIGRLHPPRSAESPRGSMRGKVVKKDGNFADERWPRRREFHIQDRFVIDRFCPGVGGRWSIVDTRSVIMSSVHGGKKRRYHVSSGNDTRDFDFCRLTY